MKLKSKGGKPVTKVKPPGTRAIKSLPVLEGELQGKGLRFGVIVSRFNEEVTQSLLEGAVTALRDHGVEEQNIEIIGVPGAFEIPIVAKQMALSGQFQGVIALGAVIRGETPHFEYISASVSHGIGQVALETNIPIGFGVLTTDTLQQAEERASLDKLNQGAQTALTVLELANLMRSLK